jgi:hypothetical protein
LAVDPVTLLFAGASASLGIAVGLTLILRPEVVSKLFPREKWERQPLWGLQRWQVGTSRWYVRLMGSFVLAIASLLLLVVVLASMK